jgi:hypothetical protein
MIGAGLKASVTRKRSEIAKRAARTRAASRESIGDTLSPSLPCLSDEADLTGCGFRRCRSVIPRSCRSLFRHDVARLGASCWQLSFGW